MNISREQFLAECKPRFGNANPERMRIAHWEWMVRSQADPFYIRQALGLESTYTSEKSSPEGHEWVGHPDWCCKARYGASYTRLADGRIICIAGHYEDSGWPDFCIYNDVIVMRPAPGEKWATTESGEVEIYGYPRDVFPPTDGHAAVQVGSTISIIGSLGYSGTQTLGTTPVRTLDTGSYRIETLEASGQGPGWIHDHHASYDAGRHAITVRGGEVFEVADKKSARNYAVHRLHLADMRWELVTARETRRKFVLEREDGGWEWDERLLRPKSIAYEPMLLRNQLIERAAIDVGGVRVRFEEGCEVNIEIEGALEEATTRRLLDEIIENLSAKTGGPWRCIETDGESRYWDILPKA